MNSDEIAAQFFRMLEHQFERVRTELRRRMNRQLFDAYGGVGAFAETFGFSEARAAELEAGAWPTAVEQLAMIIAEQQRDEVEINDDPKYGRLILKLRALTAGRRPGTFRTREEAVAAVKSLLAEAKLELAVESAQSERVQ